MDEVKYRAKINHELIFLAADKFVVMKIRASLHRQVAACSSLECT